MKSILLAIAFLLTPAIALADDLSLTGTAGVQSQYVERGVSVSADEPSLGLDLRLSNVFVDGLFVSGDFNTVETNPTNDLSLRSDVGIGYANGLNGFDWQVSLNRVTNSALYLDDYTEAQANASYGWVFAQVNQGLTDGVNQDTYVAVGAKDEVVNGLTVGVLLSGVRYDVNDEFRYNNTEAFASYKVWKGLEVFGTYSIGGDDINGNDLDNEGWVGVRYNF